MMTKLEALTSIAQTVVRHRVAMGEYVKATHFNIRLTVEHCAQLFHVTAEDEDAATAEIARRMLPKA